MKIKEILHTFIRKITRRKVLVTLTFSKRKLNLHYDDNEKYIYDVISNNTITKVLQELSKEYEFSIQKLYLPYSGICSITFKCDKKDKNVILLNFLNKINNDDDYIYNIQF